MHNYVVFEKVRSPHLESLSEVSTHYIKEWFREWSSYVDECNVAVVEGSHPSSIHTGFEIGMILARNKPVILLYRVDKNPTFIHELYSSKLIKSEYNTDNLYEVLDWCFAELEHSINRRFTFFVSPDIDRFLEQVSKKSEMSRAEYIRLLIEKEMHSHR